MGTITMSGFNKIDFGAILNAVMTQERLPLNSLQADRSTLQSRASAFGTLATNLGTLESAASALTSASSLGGRTATVSDDKTLTATAASTAMTGTYDIVVTELAHAQVTTLSADPLTPIRDRDTTVVATGGDLTFLDGNGQPLLDAQGSQMGKVTLAAGSYTLQQLADAINASDAPARATIVQADGNYRLVLTGKETGAAHAFTLQNNLAGGPLLTAATAMAATDADLLVNNVRVTSDSNVVDGALDGVTLTLVKKTTGSPVTVTVGEDTSVTQTKLEAFITAFNSLVEWVDGQAAAARKGERDNIGFDPLLRSLRSTFGGLLNRAYPLPGAFKNLAEIGVEFSRTGKLSLNKTLFTDAIKTHRVDVEQLLAGSGGVEGAFASITSAIEDYTKAGGLIPDAKSRLDSQLTALDARIDAMERRLALRQAALQAEYAAADMLISQLNSQGGSLAGLSGSFSAF